ncbi:Phosphatidyl-myo-inositol mannosyltransferase [Austwickia sp. TVS 96-490-7B]|uniref:glycosyltransferase family 4 protein n=1 Tax=Austwickia sp. TVS 96-490-7B TaxID=2830843 RepID=UPI001D6ECFFB|nr:glycosyltransferase family 4 protein [Austwickia sp. TVS 96-490-7B]MBW3084734.1 Phosphatidyl-myo-inositol mannosyltransferase [Austwickia sp. TVS 96-490-7B]
MKIALLSDCYLPRLGGIEVQVRDLAYHLLAAGHEVEVFTATLGENDEHGGQVQVVDGLPIHRMGIPLPGRIPANPLAASELKRRLAAGGFDVAHVHMGITSPFTVDCTRVALQLGLPVSMTWHCMLGPAEPLFHLSQIARLWARSGVAMNAVSAVASQPVQRALGRWGTCHVLPNGIDAATWWGLAEEHEAVDPPCRDGELQVVTAMRLANRKRPLPLLAAMRQVRQRIPEVPFRLTILGEGRQGVLARAYVQRHGMADWVDMPGRVSRPELLTLYRRSHVYVSPAKLESFGIAALEARCVGLPVVARATSGCVEFIDSGVNGYLADDDKGMVSAMTELLTDHDLRERMWRYNMSTPPVQDWSNVVELTLAEYRRAAALRGLTLAGR